ncbi:Vacuolar protein sorting-associated protein 55 [Erysiphe neolycopersici]|uniref:Vacuolar protein sorting-associated protein 55 n=1 Tax=Erysiphe neolycopersici TaxID=212602 RepID=A0A420I543_9PEZI|nr:Vacuolar protein sorting-associated protein 55 [Erysiphe neolycopersici]
MTAGLKTIILLSFVLAIGFLLVILSCALFHQYLPFLVVVTYVLAPLPIWVCGRMTSPDDFSSEDSGNWILDVGRFCSGFMVLMGIALPIVLAHSDIIRWSAAVMSILGGALIYGTIITFGMFFQEESDF